MRPGIGAQLRQIYIFNSVYKLAPVVSDWGLELTPKLAKAERMNKGL